MQKTTKIQKTTKKISRKSQPTQATPTQDTSTFLDKVQGDLQNKNANAKLINNKPIKIYCSSLSILPICLRNLFINISGWLPKPKYFSDRFAPSLHGLGE